MALPAGRAAMGRFKGDKGDTGTFADAHAVPVAYDETDLKPIMFGPESKREITFKLPRGLPGSNAVPSDTAVGTYLRAVDSVSRAAFRDALQGEAADGTSPLHAALNAFYPVFRVWDGAAYPAREAGACNIFIGPVDPQPIMGAVDFWARSDVTTLAAVAAGIRDSSSDIFQALMDINRSVVDIPLTGAGGGPLEEVPGASLFGYRAAPGVTTTMIGQITLPYGWARSRVRVYFYVPTGAGAGQIRLSRQGGLYRSEASVSEVSAVVSGVVNPNTGRTQSLLLPGEIETGNYSRLSLAVKRVGTSEADTLAANIHFTGARLERLS